VGQVKVSPIRAADPRTKFKTMPVGDSTPCPGIGLTWCGVIEGHGPQQDRSASGEDDADDEDPSSAVDRTQGRSSLGAVVVGQDGQRLLPMLVIVQNAAHWAKCKLQRPRLTAPEMLSAVLLSPRCNGKSSSCLLRMARADLRINRTELIREPGRERQAF